MGIAGTLLLGLVGALVGGLIGSLLRSGDEAFEPAGLLGSILGAILVLLALQWVGRRSGWRRGLIGRRRRMW